MCREHSEDRRNKLYKIRGRNYLVSYFMPSLPPPTSVCHLSFLNTIFGFENPGCANSQKGVRALEMVIFFLNAYSFFFFLIYLFMAVLGGSSFLCEGFL